MQVETGHPRNGGRSHEGDVDMRCHYVLVSRLSLLGMSTKIRCTRGEIQLTLVSTLAAGFPAITGPFCNQQRLRLSSQMHLEGRQ